MRLSRTKKLFEYSYIRSHEISLSQWLQLASGTKGNTSKYLIVSLKGLPSFVIVSDRACVGALKVVLPDLTERLI